MEEINCRSQIRGESLNTCSFRGLAYIGWTSKERKESFGCTVGLMDKCIPHAGSMIQTLDCGQEVELPDQGWRLISRILFHKLGMEVTDRLIQFDLSPKL